MTLLYGSATGTESLGNTLICGWTVADAFCNVGPVYAMPFYGSIAGRTNSFPAGAGYFVAPFKGTVTLVHWRSFALQAGLTLLQLVKNDATVGPGFQAQSPNPGAQACNVAFAAGDRISMRVGVSNAGSCVILVSATLQMQR